MIVHHYTLFILFLNAFMVNKKHFPYVFFWSTPVHKCKTDIRSGPALMKYTTINPSAYLQHACITLSAVLRFSSTGDMSYCTLSQTTLWGFITVAYNSKWKKIWMQVENGRESGEAGKLIHFACSRDRGIWMKDRGGMKKKWGGQILFQNEIFTVW